MSWRSAKVLSRAIVIQQTFMGTRVATGTGDAWSTRSHGAGPCLSQYQYRVFFSLACRPQSHVLYPFQGPTVVAPPDRGSGGDLSEPPGDWLGAEQEAVSAPPSCVGGVPSFGAALPPQRLLGGQLCTARKDGHP
jgi:hypothetical protein